MAIFRSIIGNDGRKVVINRNGFIGVLTFQQTKKKSVKFSFTKAKLALFFLNITKTSSVKGRNG